MTYNVFGGTLNLAQSIDQSQPVEVISDPLKKLLPLCPPD